MANTIAPSRGPGARNAAWLALAAAFLAALVVIHPWFVAATIGAVAGAGWLAARNQEWTALRVVLLVAFLTVFAVAAVPFAIWFAVAGIWLASRRFHSLRPESGWLPVGPGGVATLWFTLVIVITAGVALTVWAETVDAFGTTTVEMADALRDVPVGLYLAGAGVFVVCNALSEEIAYRVLIFDAAQRVVSPRTAAVIQALAFGLLHIRGFPAGWIGVILATIYGLSLGILRLMSGGMRAPLIAHIAADATIAALFLVVVVPAAT